MKALQSVGRLLGFGLAAGSIGALGGCQSETPSTPVASTDGVQRATILIDGGKYTPSEIRVAKGKPVELTFTGGKVLGCGGTVVFKDLNISKKVESGQSVTINFTPDQAGEIRFTCSMDMYDGKVIVN